MMEHARNRTHRGADSENGKRENATHDSSGVGGKAWTGAVEARRGVTVW